MKKITLIFALIALILLGLVISQKRGARVEPGMTEANGALVEGFPQFPQISSAVIVNSYKKVDGAKSGYQAEYGTNQTPYDVMVWYRQTLASEGWTITDEAIDSMVNDLYLTAEKEGSRVNVFSETEDGKTEITVEFPLQ